MKPNAINIFISCFIFLSQSMGKETLSFKSFFTVDRLGSPVVSPNGKYVAFSVQKADLEENSYLTQIWMINEDGSGLRQFTYHTASSTNPQFSTNSDFLYFLSNRDGDTQIWRKNLSGGEAEKVTDIFGGVTGFQLSAEPDKILLVRRVPPDCYSEDCIKQILDLKRNSKIKARIIDHLMFRHWNEWLEGNYNHLFLYSSQDILDLTPGEVHTPTIALGSSHDFSFSPNGKEVVLVANKEINSATSTNNDIYLRNINSNKTEKISISLGNDNNPHFSPDGKYIAYASMERAGFEADRQRLMIFDLTNKTTRELTTGFSFSITDLRWSPHSQEIYFTADRAGSVSLFKVSLFTKEIIPVLTGHDLKDFHFLDENRLVFLKQTSQMPHELYSYSLNDKKLKKLTQFNDSLLANIELPPAESFWFLGAQGDSVQGFIMKPPHYQEGKQYPAVHMIHGGPQGMWRYEWHFRWNYQMFAAPGYAVYYINFHGSRGYGQRFTDSISQHWGDLPYDDLVKGTEYVLKHYNFVDPQRLAAAGASYGGFMVNWIAGHENPYKCLISHDGSYDQKSMWGETEELWFPEWEMGGLPWEKGTTYDKWSPSRLAHNFKTPMLVIHGEHDYRLAYTQSLQLFSALQRRGVPSRLLFFPDEDHFVRKPLNAQLWWETVHEWLAKYLKY